MCSAESGLSSTGWSLCGGAADRMGYYVLFFVGFFFLGGGGGHLCR